MWWATEVMVMKGQVWYPQNTLTIGNRVVAGHHGSCTVEQGGAEDLGGIFIRIQDHDDRVGASEEGDLDGMLDAEFVGGVVSNLEGSLTGRTYRACKIDIEITVEVSMAEPTPEKDGNSPDLAMTLDDRHDHVTSHGSK